MRQQHTNDVGDDYLALGLSLMKDPIQGWYLRKPGSRYCLRLTSVQQASLLLEWFAPREALPPITEWKSEPQPVGNLLAR